ELRRLATRVDHDGVRGPIGRPDDVAIRGDRSELVAFDNKAHDGRVYGVGPGRVSGFGAISASFCSERATLRSCLALALTPTPTERAEQSFAAARKTSW